MFNKIYKSLIFLGLILINSYVIADCPPHKRTDLWTLPVVVSLGEGHPECRYNRIVCKINTKKHYNRLQITPKSGFNFSGVSINGKNYGKATDIPINGTGDYIIEFIGRFNGEKNGTSFALGDTSLRSTAVVYCELSVNYGNKE